MTFWRTTNSSGGDSDLIAQAAKDGDNADTEARAFEDSAGAVIVGPYRYVLWRSWGNDECQITVILLNPSRADATHDDPTLRRCLQFARSLSYSRLELVNLFAYRSPSPTALRQVADPVGPENDNFIIQSVARAQDVVIAWGNGGRNYLGRDQAVLTLLAGVPLLCLGQTRSGAPRHPLYLPRATALRPFVRNCREGTQSS